MAIIVSNYITNIIQSLCYFLNNVTYTKNNETKTLRQHYNDPQLEIILGFPPSLKELILPTIAIVSQAVAEKIEACFQNQYDEIIYPFHIYGFCGGCQSYEENQLLRDKLSNDIRTILEETEYFNIYNVSDPPVADNFVTALTDSEFLNVRSSNLAPTGILIADRYRFLIEFDIAYVRTID